MIFLFDYIRTEIFICFGLYSLVFTLLSFFIKENPILKEFEETSIKLTRYAGLAYLLLFILIICTSYFNSTEAEQQVLTNRMLGRYWIGFWLQTFIYVAISQLLVIKKIASSRLVKFLFAIFLLISIEKMVIIITSLHRSYLPSDWSTVYNISIGQLIIGFLVKVIIYIATVALLYFLTKQVKKLKFNN